jgi:hypothetical protein
MSDIQHGFKTYLNNGFVGLFFYICSAIGSQIFDSFQMEMKRESGSSPELFP